MTDEIEVMADSGMKPVPPVAPERAWIRPLRDSYDDEGVETDGAPVLLFAGHDTQDADASAEAMPCLEEDGFVRGEPAEYVRVDIHDAIAAQLAAARAALEEIAALQTEEPESGLTEDIGPRDIYADMDDCHEGAAAFGIRRGHFEAAEIARRALGGGR